MYLEKAIFINRAPFEHLEIDFKESGINVLTAINGKGKTTILSHIVDALHELARDSFPQSYEGRQNKFYRFSSPVFDIPKAEYSIFYARFIYNGSHIDYIDCRGELSQEEYENSIKLRNKIEFSEISYTLTNEKHVRRFSNTTTKKIVDIFNSRVLTYFPSYRYEQPWYLNDPYKLQFNFNVDATFSGFLPNPIEVVSDMPQIANWIMDVVLDWQINKSEFQPSTSGYPYFSPDNVTISFLNTSNYVTEDFQTIDNLNNILRATLSSKMKDVPIRYGIGKRNMALQRVSIVKNQSGEVLLPNIFGLSSGESSLVCVFGEILRQGDKLVNNIPPSEISGIVLIDEVDKHLHITLQKEILPQLFALYPKIQFIVSSHSPFLNMGLAENQRERSHIIDLDNHGNSYIPEQNDEYINVYNMMVSENARFAEESHRLKKALESTHALLESINKPLILTEGETDELHIKSAAKALGIDASSTFHFLEEDKKQSNRPSGADDLMRRLEALGKSSICNIVIGILDADIKPKFYKSRNSDGTYHYGGKVYAIQIQAPQHRLDSNQTFISIEQLYSNEEITTWFITEKRKVRLYISTEFSEQTKRHKIEKDVNIVTHKDLTTEKIVDRNGDQGVYNIDEVNLLATKAEFAHAIEKGQIEISKESWENFRHIFTTIETIVQKHAKPLK